MKISIIIPIYGVEAYIEKCADSLLSQSYRDIEYIFVNDCTKDNSMEVLNGVINSRYSDRANDIIIINKQENQGLPQARCSGVKVATGEYIMHCDSDDWLEPDAVTILVNHIIENNRPDMVCFSNYEVSQDSKHIRHVVPSANIDEHRRRIIGLRIEAYMWASITKRERYVGILYPIENMLEDFVIMSQLVHNCQTISYLDMPIYSYLVSNSNSILHQDKKKVRYQRMCTNMSIVYDWFIDNAEYAVSIDHLTYIYGWRMLKGGVPKTIRDSSIKNLKRGIRHAKLFRHDYETSLRKRIEVKIASLLNFPSYF